MPAGSGARYLYPSTASWLVILDELERRFPDAVFTFVGRLGAAGGRTSSGIARAEVDRLLGSRRRAIDAFDRPILEQLALVEASSLFVSPHTGFGFAAVAVGTPWLTLSGGDWHEYFFNGVPFYSVLPKSREHPAFVHSRSLPMIDADSDGEGPRTATMSAAASTRTSTSSPRPRRRSSRGGSRTRRRSPTTSRACWRRTAATAPARQTFEDVHLRYV